MKLKHIYSLWLEFAEQNIQTLEDTHKPYKETIIVWRCGFCEGLGRISVVRQLAA